MKKLLKIFLAILTALGDISSIAGAYKTYRLDIDSFYNQIKSYNIIAIGEAFAIIGTLIFIAIVLIYFIVKLIVREPQKSVVDLVAPILLPKEELGTSDYTKERIEYWFVVIGVSLMVTGVLLVFGEKLFNYFI